MPKHSTQLLSKENSTSEILTVNLKKPPGMSYIAGQNINIKLPELMVADPRGQRRTFTLSSAPQDDELSITMRLTNSGFKKTLKDLPTGTKLEFMGPNGRFYLYENIDKVVMIAGGIGITPFKSIIQDVASTGRSVDIHLYYSSGQSLYSPYHNQFRLLSSHPNFQLKYVPTLTRKNNNWDGCVGRVDIKMIKKFSLDYLERNFFICGPPDMVDDIKGKLLTHGISIDKIHIESFYGY
jgi:glycine betaine catabolism B